jgi:23S rRNA pseudouridine1911/1915/1917 synthase
MNDKITKLTATQAGNIRIDKFLTSSLSDITRSKVQYLIKNGYILLGNEPITDSAYKVKVGDEFTVQIPPVKPTNIKPKNIDLNIVYEDEYLVVINKPPGLVTHPGAGNYDDTLANGLLAHFKENLSTIGGEARPGILHRLDKNTSGLLLVAKNDVVHAKLAQQLKDREIKRIYRAVIWGIPTKMQDIIRTNIGRSKKDRKKMTVLEEGGKVAVTHYKVLKTFLQGAFSLIECNLETGRTHQIRVHLSYLGYPIVSDPEYGNIRKKMYAKLPEEIVKYSKSIDRQMLHAKKIIFTHPVTEKLCEFEIDLPSDIAEFISLISKHAEAE